MPYTDAGKRVMLEALRGAAAYLSLHSDVPSLANEVDAPRQPVALSAPIAGRVRMNGDRSFEVPEGTEVRQAGFWTAVRGGEMLAYGAVPEAVFKGPGTYVVDAGAIDLNA